MLGRGTFGVVMRARRHPNQWQGSAPVAIKITPRATQGASRELSTMLRLRSEEGAASCVIQLQEYFFATSGNSLFLCQVSTRPSRVAESASECASGASPNPDARDSLRY